jgi:branched-chain amino acid transport system permease protein
MKVSLYPGPALYLVVGIFGGLAAVGPLLLLGFGSVVTTLLIYMALAYSLNLITGLTGYVHFGHVIFMGIGAYALGVTASAFRLDPLPGVLLGASLGFAFAVGIGLVTLRFRGAYFAIASLVLVLGTQNAILAIPQLGEGRGIFLNFGSFQPLSHYYTIWAIVFIEAFLTYWIKRGRIGYGIRALKGDEDAARALGVDAARLKLVLFSLSGLFAGAAGAVYAWTTSNLVPPVNFAIRFSLLMLAMIIIGGLGTDLGPLIGAAIVYLLSYVFATTPLLIGFDLIVIGVLVTVMALFLPQGIVGMVRERVPSLRKVLE